MGRSAEAESVQNVAELFAGLFFRDAERLEHGGLQVAFMDADGTASQLRAVEHHVVGLRAKVCGEFPAEQFLFVFLDGAGKGVVDGDPALLFLIPAHQREFNNPQEVAFLVVLEQFHEFGALQAHAAQDIAGGFPRAGGKENEVSCFDVQGFREFLLFFVGKEFGDGASPVFLAHLDVGQALGSGFHGGFRQGVDLSDGGGAEPLGVDGLDHASIAYGGGEYLEPAVFKDGGDVRQLHAEAAFRLVGTVLIHCFLPGHAGEGGGNVHAQGFLVHAFEQAFHQVVDVFRRDEGSFNVHLGEFRLAVRAQVFVTEAAGNLEIAFHASHHEQLLVLLRGLGQRVEFAGRQAGGHQEVPCAFRRGFGEDGRFNFQKAVLVQIVARGFGDAVADLHVAGHGRAAQVQKAVFEAQVFVGEGPIQLEGEHVSLVDDVQGVCGDFDFPGGEVRIGRVHRIRFQAGGHGAGNLDHVFGAELLGGFRHILIDFRVKDYLRDAGAVAQVDKYDAAMVPDGIYPADEGGRLADVRSAQFAAGMSAV